MSDRGQPYPFPEAPALAGMMQQLDGMELELQGGERTGRCGGREEALALARIQEANFWLQQAHRRRRGE